MLFGVGVVVVGGGGGGGGAVVVVGGGVGAVGAVVAVSGVALPSFLIANKKFKEVEEFADEYEMEDLKTINTAKTFAIVALTINGVFLLYSIYNLTTTDWDIVKQQYLDAVEQYQQ